jgi:hypothetical protein
MTFRDTPDGQTHSFNDGCGEPLHNSPDLIQYQEDVDAGVDMSTPQHDSRNEKCVRNKECAFAHLQRCPQHDCSCHQDRIQADKESAKAIRAIMNSKQPLSVAKSEGVRRGSA